MRAYAFVFSIPFVSLLLGHESVSSAGVDIRRSIGSDQTNTSYEISGSTYSQGQWVSGWVQQPNFRGTWEILWVNLLTIFICTYSLLCLNVPAPKDQRWHKLGRRLKWICIAVLGPEFVLTYAAGQWSRACQSVQAFRRAGYAQWKMRQAFFADAGGFVFHARDSTPFPLNAKQLHWLIINKIIDFPNTSIEEIWDKSKQDTLLRLITAVQIGYTVLQGAARATRHLTITTLELVTLSIVVCSLMTSFAWFHKPSEVRVGITLTSRHSIDEILISHGNSEDQDKLWRNTPLDFIDDNTPGYSMNIQPFMHMPTIPSARPIQRIPNDRFPTNPYGCQEYALCLASLVFAALHLAGWHFHFPTYTKKILWRVASLVLFGITAAFWILETMASWIRLGRWKRLYRVLAGKEDYAECSPLGRAGNLQRKAKKVRKKPLPLPWEFWSIAPLAAVYGVARLYLIVEALVELRRMEATAYINVQWTNYLPHV